MQKINVNDEICHPFIQQLWQKSLLPEFVGIIMGDGRLISINQNNYFIDHEIRHELKIGEESTIDNLLELTDDTISITPYGQGESIAGTDALASCGEGEMGNEGFVAVTNTHGLLWAAFFANSNPFYQVNIVGDCVAAVNSYEATWYFPIDSPWNITITYAR
ncbi:hypothetical protein IV454_00785 [Massilia antarctica]|uniref:Uncharacterized protein n=1 Tax=Massilia antarctica TaxID=2765360 RepID=A0AA48WES6_9BURK|nr:hypothetical protein [Massilia antarctica]QPI50212.1 hypothetical protein IV454_00785 [Massilia antarctica]